MISGHATIINRQGIHVRPSKVISDAVIGYTGSITVTKDDFSIDQVNTIMLLTLALTEGDRITIEVDGPDEPEMLEKLIGLFETPFDFPPRVEH